MMMMVELGLWKWAGQASFGCTPQGQGSAFACGKATFYM
jgi:hypothetical protein